MQSCMAHGVGPASILQLFVLNFNFNFTHTLFFLLVFEHMDRVASTVAEKGLNFKLREGFSAETSGKREMGS